MKCPLCDLEMVIKEKHRKIENDDTPDKETKVYIIHDMTCRNRKCNNYNKVVEQVKDEVKF